MKKIAGILKKLYSDSVSFKLLTVFLVCFIIPLLILIQLFSYNFHSVLVKKERSYTSEKIRYVTSQFTNILSEMDSIATALILDDRITDILIDPGKAPSYEWFNDFKSLNSTLSLLAYNANNQYSITIMGSDNTLYQTSASFNNNLNMQSPICKHIQKQNGRLVLFNRKLIGFDHENMLTLGRAVYYNQNLIGIIMVEVPVSYLNEIISPLTSSSPDTQLYILQNSREVLYSTIDSASASIPAALQESLLAEDDEVKITDTTYLLQQQAIPRMSVSVVALSTKDSVFQDSTSVLLRFTIVFLIIIGITVFGVFLLIMDIKKSERSKRILEFQSLQAQINPHMIYNTLNTITYLAELQNVTNILEVSSSFASLLRSLSNIQGEYLTIRQEIDYLKAYVSIKKYNLISDIQVTYQIDERALDCLILKLILQPILENAMIHGLANKPEGGVITVSIKKVLESIHISISDNGNGMTEETIAQIMNGSAHSGSTFLRVGMHNIIERLTIQYGENSQFHINSIPGAGTTVSLAFPAQTQKEEGL